MIKYEYAEQVKNKLIEILLKDRLCEKILRKCNYCCTYEIDQDATLYSVNFNGSDNISCLNDGVYISYNNNMAFGALHLYDSFDELLKM